MAVQACHECHAETVVLYYVGRQHFAKRCATCGHDWKEEREAEPEPTVREGGWVSRAA